jgi:hypothetical protein
LRQFFKNQLILVSFELVVIRVSAKHAQCYLSRNCPPLTKISNFARQIVVIGAGIVLTVGDGESPLGQDAFTRAFGDDLMTLPRAEPREEETAPLIISMLSMMATEIVLVSLNSELNEITLITDVLTFQTEQETGGVFEHLSHRVGVHGLFCLSRKRTFRPFAVRGYHIGLEV